MGDNSTFTLADWQSAASNLSIRHQAFINGEYVDAASGKTFASINPATGATNAMIAEGDVEDINRAVAAARHSFKRRVESTNEPQSLASPRRIDSRERYRAGSAGKPRYGQVGH